MTTMTAPTLELADTAAQAIREINHRTRDADLPVELLPQERERGRWVLGQVTSLAALELSLIHI